MGRSPENTTEIIEGVREIFLKIYTEALHQDPEQAQTSADQICADLIYETAHQLEFDVDQPGTVEELNFETAKEVLEEMIGVYSENEVNTRLLLEVQTFIKQWQMTVYTPRLAITKANILESVLELFESRNQA